MSKYNIYIVRAMSKKQRKAYLAIAAKYSYKKYLKLNFTFTNNNIFVNLCNGLGESLFKKTFGLIGYNGLKRKSRYALYYYGLEVGIELKKYILTVLDTYVKTIYKKNPWLLQKRLRVSEIMRLWYRIGFKLRKKKSRRYINNIMPQFAYNFKKYKKKKAIVRNFKRATQVHLQSWNIKFILNSVFLKTDFRYKRFMDGFRKAKINFCTMSYKKAIPYNGCKVCSSRRTRRFRRFK
jgi:hypothetical protein